MALSTPASGFFVGMVLGVAKRISPWRRSEVWKDGTSTGVQKKSASGLPLWSARFACADGRGGITEMTVTIGSQVKPVASSLGLSDAEVSWSDVMEDGDGDE